MRWLPSGPTYVRSVAGGAGEAGSGPPGGLSVAFGDGYDGTVGVVGGGQGDSASAEACAGEPGAEHAGGTRGDVDERVKFGAADLVVVAQAVVWLGQQLAALVGVAASQGGGGV